MKKGRMRWSYSAVRLLVQSTIRLIFKVRIYNIERLPTEGRLLIVSNHTSYLDPPLIGSIVPREVSYAAKIQLFKGLLGKIIRHLNAIPVRRSGSDKEAIKALAGALTEGKAVLIFPEGTRTLKPEDRDLKRGVGMLAMMSGANLIPMRVDGSHQLKLAFQRKQAVTVRFGNVIELNPLIEDNPPRKEAYKRITAALMEEIDQLSDDMK